jgi:Eukaryotic initiation factor 4E
LDQPNNANGGKWVVRMPKGLASRYWEEIILALIGGQFGTTVPENEICGAVLSLRYNEDILGIWNRHANATSDIEKIRMAIQRILQLPPNAHMEYKPHETSLQDRTGGGGGGGTTSFRSTHAPAPAWKPKVDRASYTTDAASNPAAPTASSSSTAASSATSSRRSGSWTERDKTLPTKSLPRGSWRN